MKEGEGGGDGEKNIVVNSDFKRKIILEVLTDIENRIDEWLLNNGKGPLTQEEMYKINNLPSCFPQNENFLTQTKTVEIPAVRNKLTNFIETIESEFSLSFLNGYDNNTSLAELKVEDRTKLEESTCKVLYTIGLDRLIACLAGAVIDVGLQYTFSWVDLWMGDNPVAFSEYETIFKNLDASQVAVSAGISCLASAFPIVPSAKNKLIIAIIAGLGDGAYAMANNIYKQYDELIKKYPNATITDILNKIDWKESLIEGGVNFAITSIAVGVVTIAKSNPKFINFAKKLEDKIRSSGSNFLRKAGFSNEYIRLLLDKLGIKNIKISYLQLPQVSVKIHAGNVNVTNHWSKFGVDFELDEIFKQRIRNLASNSIADVAEEAVIAQFTKNGFVPFLTKYGGNNGLDALLANSDDLATATRIIILEVKSSTTKNVPFNVKLGEGYGGYQLDNVWLNGVINKMIGPGEMNKAIEAAGYSLRKIFDSNPTIIEKYIAEVDKSGFAKIIKLN